MTGTAMRHRLLLLFFNGIQLHLFFNPSNRRMHFKLLSGEKKTKRENIALWTRRLQFVLQFSSFLTHIHTHAPIHTYTRNENHFNCSLWIEKQTMRSEIHKLTTVFIILWGRERIEMEKKICSKVVHNNKFTQWFVIYDLVFAVHGVHHFASLLWVVVPLFSLLETKTKCNNKTKIRTPGKWLRVQAICFEVDYIQFCRDVCCQTVSVSVSGAGIWRAIWKFVNQ